MKKQVLFLFVLVFLIGLVSASFTKSNISIENKYAPGDKLKGTLNISLQDEPTNSLLTAFNSSMKIIDFLEGNLVSSDFSCTPVDCETGYIPSNKETNKKFSNLLYGDKRVIGLKISGDIDSISSFSMKINSTAGESGFPQLSIDVLNDNSEEWIAYNASNNFRKEIYGCFDSGVQPAEITQIEYCERLILPPTPNVKIGANINEVLGKGGNVDFIMRIYNDDYDGSCTASASGSGKINCVVNLSITFPQDFFACIRTKNSEDNNKYSINSERNNPCGFTGSFDDNYNYDFDIFAQPGNYYLVGTFTLDNNELANSGNNMNLAIYIEDYIYERYENNCVDGCIIPIKIISGITQTITMSDASLSYVSGISTTTHDIYDLTEEPAKINMDFKELDLEKAGLIVPTEYGSQDLVLKLGGEEIISKTIEIARVPVIDRVIPLSVPAAMPVKFIVFASEGNITEYKWDFGDGSIETTTINSTYHSYSSIGTYNLKVTVVNEAGEASKTFTVEVKSPEDQINNTLTVKRRDLSEIKSQLSAITGWYKTEIEKIVNLDVIEGYLDDIERKYEIASSSSEYVEIMSSLMDLKIPSSITSTSLEMVYFPNTDYIDPNYLIELGVKDVDEPERYRDSIVSWISQNLDINIESKIYYLNFEDTREAILSSFIVKIKSKEDFPRESYLIIEKSYDGLIFKEDYKEKSLGGATAITFSQLEQDKEERIEFILPERIEIIELPFYISPEFSQLPEPENGKISPCDSDKKCEKELGENSKNCPSDCKNWAKIIIYFAILLFLAFVCYIALQEWYKRYYERHLFKNQNDLFNLINFINNALNQGLTKGEIIDKLKKHKWSNEQITYAFKKVLGKRTGMWEIPIFKWFEKRKIERELAKRRQIGMQPPIGG